MLFLIKYIIFVIITIVISYIDIKYRKIPDMLSLPLVTIGLIFSFFSDDPSIKQALVGAILGFVAFYLLALIHLKLTKSHGLGGGDIKFIAGIGAFVGGMGVIFVIFFSAMFALVFLCIKRNRDMVVSYAPFLTISAFLYIIYKNFLTSLL